ncbi:MAG: hypothetical protein PHZ19_10255 [Candidatus Thermoplasmatota archaeon]|nr:hypothetical protein [Candidatus Thermoplasmatota archaeon]
MRFYDLELLEAHLGTAFAPGRFTIRKIEGGGWSFFVAECWK